MAQAARLSLRMQKELKLLLADPPPRASFPFLSPLSDLSSLSTILAQIEGPEGSVYADGVFKIKIQIPERYPFQPPSVTFQTPIYHPNIDNGGRICLDVLNLPPKGAWQPSLNISTILTSIGLLLSEPNPDDGLMCEASREYKYNRQAFDEKARSVTQKYAMAGASGSIFDNPCMEQNSSPNLQMEGDRSMNKTHDRVNEFETGKKNLGGFTRKLSLICSSSSQSKDGDGEVNDGRNTWESDSNSENCLDVDKTRYEQGIRDGSNHKTPDGMVQNSSLALQEYVFQDNHDGDKKTVVPHYQSLSPHSLLMTSDSFVVQSHKPLDQFSTVEKEIVDCTLEKPFSEQMHQSTASGLCQLVSAIEAEMLKMPRLLPSKVLNSSESSTEMPRNGRQTEVESRNDLSGDKCDASAGTKRKKLCLGGRQLSLGLKGSYLKGDAEAKENLGLTGKVELSGPLDISMKRLAGQKSSLGPLTQLQECNTRISQFSCPASVSKDCLDSKLVEPDHGRRMKRLDRDRNVKYAEEINEKGPKELPTPDSVIVLDSEDSEDEGKASSTVKSVLARKRVANSKLRA